MIEITKFRPYCQVAIWLAVFFVILNLALKGLSSTPVLSWLPETVTGTGFVEDARRRVVQAEEEYRLGRVRATDHLGVFVGISNLREAIDLGLIGSEIGPQWRFLGVAGAGFGMRDFVDYAQLISESELRPDVAVLGFGVHQLADPRISPTFVEDDDDVLSLLLRGDLRNAAVVARNSLWIYSRRRDISVTVDTSILALRGELMRRFGVPLTPEEMEKVSPWREMVRSDFPDHFSQATLDAQEEYLGVRGLFDRATYHTSPATFGLFLDTIERFRRQHTRVILVLMPESTKLHRLVPAEAFDVLKHELESRFPGDAPPILDYRQAVTDDDLVDHVHVNSKGRREFSRLLARDLPKYLPDGIPLMAAKTKQTRSN